MGICSIKQFYDVRIRECGSGRQNRYQISHDDARIREYGSGRRNRSKFFSMMTRGSGEYGDPGVRAVKKKILFHVDARIRGVRILASTKF